MALLDLVATWARRHDRPVVALTVDHRLHPDSALWSQLARDLARQIGCSWQGLVWTDPTPGPGVTARARAARHALLADATRAADADVLLLAHTRDDRHESDWMRAHEGTSLGHLRDWSPSPSWPEGRGLMLFRPLLDEERAVLRNHLQERGLGWVDDPANADPTYGRSRARRALAQEPGSDGALSAVATAACHQRQLPECDEWGGITVARDIDRHVLAACLVAASGGTRLPRRDQNDRLLARLGRGEDFVATLVGSRLWAMGPTVRIGRHRDVRSTAGTLTELALEPGVPSVWDGRFEIVTDQFGWRVTAAAGLRAHLSRDDRAALAACPAPERGAQPVLISAGGTDPVLAGPGPNRRCWVGHRLILALGQIQQEQQIRIF